MFPVITTPAEFDAAAPRTELFLAGARAIAARHRVSGPITRLAEGSMLVFTVGDDAVLKLFAPPYRVWFLAERAFLERIHGRLGVPTPEILGADELDGYGYVLMSRLRGTPLDRVLPGLPPDARARVIDELGSMVAQLHALPTDGLPAEDWEAFVDRQITSCVATQQRRGLAPAWLEQIPEFLARHRPRPPHPRALVHSELGPGHVLVEAGRITGVIDFADALVGDPDFELPAVGIFITRGDAALYQRFLAALGRDVAPERAFTYALLHRYSNLPWYLRELPPGDQVHTLAQLAHTWFGRRPLP